MPRSTNPRRAIHTNCISNAVRVPPCIIAVFLQYRPSRYPLPPLVPRAIRVPLSPTRNTSLASFAQASLAPAARRLRPSTCLCPHLRQSPSSTTQLRTVHDTDPSALPNANRLHRPRGSLACCWRVFSPALPLLVEADLTCARHYAPRDASDTSDIRRRDTAPRLLDGQHVDLSHHTISALLGGRQLPALGT
jgi:hypothetical protein